MNKTIDKKKLKVLGIKLAAALFLIMVIGYKPYKIMGIEKKADRYLAQNYPIIYRQSTLYNGPNETGYYLHEKDKWVDVWWLYYGNHDDDFMRFEMLLDKKGNVIFDGCGESYMKGSTIYEHYDLEYQKMILGLMEKGFDVKEAETGNIPPEKQDGSIRFIAGFNPAVGQNLNAPDRYKYNGPVIDINQKYTTRDLALEHGCIYIAFTGDEPGADRAFRRYLQVKEWVEENHIPFRTIRIGRDFNECLFLTYDEFSDYRYTDDLRANYVVF